MKEEETRVSKGGGGGRIHPPHGMNGGPRND